VAAIRRPIQTATVLLIAGWLLTGCGNTSSPSATQASKALKADIDKVLLAENAQGVQVEEDGTKPLPCGKKKAQYQYVMAFAKRHAPGFDQYREAKTIGGLILGLDGYTYVRDPRNHLPIQLINKKAGTNVIVDSHALDHISIVGYTDCLPNS
jgi:hypothetical protein